MKMILLIKIIAAVMLFVLILAFAGYLANLLIDKVNGFWDGVFFTLAAVGPATMLALYLRSLRSLYNK